MHIFERHKKSMLQIKNTIISSDLLNKNFCCDLESCKGACCIHGDVGAPLTDFEVKKLSLIYQKLKPFIREEGVRAIEELGTYVVDDENETVTPLIDGKECAYVVFDNGVARCGIENAYTAGEVDFRKPISCFLYPIRIKKYEQFIAVNYDQWNICESARKNGDRKNLPVYKFVEEALTQRFGTDWFRHLRIAAREIKKD
ncbi:MAG: DUF3109 family protein [Bacteroidales bacterium]|nr:DUF3109 family protein [Bacteroidales bacterium]